MSDYSWIIGNKFGRWHVKEKDEETSKKHGRPYFKCVCDCGTVRSVSAKDLRNGKSTSCGCLRREEASKAVRLNITGERQGRLVAIKIDEKKSTPGNIYWICKCDCGNYISISTGQFRSGNTKSCGCLRKELLSRPNKYEIFGNYGKCYFNDSDEYFLFDTRDLDIVTSHTWRKSNGYARADERDENGIYHAIQFHREVLKKYHGNIDDYQVDHKNHNTLDDRYYNIRLCTRSQNQLNRNFKNSSNTGIRNISYFNDQFHVQFKYNGKTTTKIFNNIEDAVIYKEKFISENPNEFRYDQNQDSRNNTRNTEIISPFIFIDTPRKAYNPFIILDPDKFYKK